MKKSDKNTIQVLQNDQLQKTTDPQEKLRQLYPDLGNPIKTFKKISFSESEDTYLLRIPKNVNPELLTGFKIDLKDCCKINLREKYILVEPITEISESTLPITSGTNVILIENNFRMKTNINLKNKNNVNQLDSFNSLNSKSCKNDLVTNTSDIVDSNQPGSSTKKLKKTKQSIMSEILDRTKLELFSNFSSSSKLPIKIKNKKSKDTVSEQGAISAACSSGPVLETVTTSVDHKNNKNNKIDILEAKSEIFNEYKTDSIMPIKSKNKKKKDKNKDNYINLENLNNNSINIEAQSTRPKKLSKKRKNTEDLDFLNSLDSETIIDSQSEKDKTNQVTVKTKSFTEHESDSSMKSKSSKKKKFKHLEQTNQANTSVQSSKEIKSIFNRTLISDGIKTSMFYPEIGCIAAETSKNSKRNLKKEKENRKKEALLLELTSNFREKYCSSEKKTGKIDLEILK